MLQRDASGTPLTRFGALVRTDDALADRLGVIERVEPFIEAAVTSAVAYGIALDPAAVRAALHPDPLGLSRFTAAALEDSCPSKQWLPVAMDGLTGEPTVQWAYFGRKPLTAPFFEMSARAALSLPINRLVRYRTSLEGLLDAGAATGVAPSGFIFHMSRCGSTLVSQMLAALPDNIVISESPPLDAIVQIGATQPPLSEERHAGLLRAIVAVYGRRRSGAERHYFIKLDSWHVMAMPLFRRAFPAVPWLFLYRDPVEVLVSQRRQTGTQFVPAFVPPSLYGLDAAEVTHGADYHARVLAKICGAAIGHLRDGGIAVNYRDLPGALFDRILPHFGVRYDAAEIETMAKAAHYDAKSPRQDFTNDSAAKQSEATAAIVAAATQHLAALYRRLQDFSKT